MRPYGIKPKNGIGAARKDLRLTQADLALRMGLRHKGQISKIETSFCLSLRTILSYAHACNMDVRVTLNEAETGKEYEVQVESVR